MLKFISALAVITVVGNSYGISFMVDEPRILLDRVALISNLSFRDIKISVY